MANFEEFLNHYDPDDNDKIILFSLLRLDPQNNQITPDDRLTVLCEITIDGKDVQESGQASGSGVSVARLFASRA